MQSSETQGLLDINFIEYYRLIDALTIHWKRLIRNHNNTQNIIQPHVTLLKTCLKSTKPFYQFLLEKVAAKNMEPAFISLYRTTEDTKLLNFQYKLIHRIMYTNSRLSKCHLMETELCTFCYEQKETLKHLFFDCCHVRTFLLQLREEIFVECHINFAMAPDTWILNSFIGTPIEMD